MPFKKRLCLILVLIFFSFPNFLTAEVIETAKIRGLKIRHVPDKKFDQHYRRKVAFCIGIDAYQSYPELECAVNDAQTMASVFKGHQFDEVILVTDKDADKENILNELLRFKSAAHEDDLFVFYFAGHGQTITRKSDNRKMGYLVPVDCNTGKEEDEGISMGIINNIATTMPNRHILFLIDCCYSGYGLARAAAAPSQKPSDHSQLKKYLASMLSLPSVQILTAGGKEDQALEYGGHGIFTYHVLQALQGETPESADGALTILELASYVKQKVTADSNGRQSPRFGYIRGNGDIVFITGKEERKVSVDTEKKLDVDDDFFASAEKEYKQAYNLKQKGYYLKAEQKMSNLYVQMHLNSKLDGENAIKYILFLAEICHKMEKNELSRFYAEKILELKANKEDQAKAMGYIAISWLKTGYYQRGWNELQKGLDYVNCEIGHDNLSAARFYFYICDYYYLIHDYKKAIPYAEKALGLFKKYLGRENEDVADAYNALGILYSALIDPQKTFEYHNKALEIRLKLLGKKHPSTLYSYINLGTYYNGKGDVDKALDNYLKALDGLEEMLGKDHPDLARLCNLIAGAYSNKKEYNKARDYAQRALSIMSEHLGDDHPDLVYIYETLAGIEFALDNKFQSLKYLQFGLKIREEKLGADNIACAHSANYLALVYYAVDDYSQAVYYFQQASKGFEKHYGKNDLNTAHAYRDLGRSYNELQKYREAAHNLQLYYQIYTSIYGVNDQKTEKAKNEYENALAAQKKLEKQSSGGIYDILDDVKEEMELERQKKQQEQKEKSRDEEFNSIIDGLLGN